MHACGGTVIHPYLPDHVSPLFSFAASGALSPCLATARLPPPRGVVSDACTPPFSPSAARGTPPPAVASCRWREIRSSASRRKILRSFACCSVACACSLARTSRSRRSPSRIEGLVGLRSCDRHSLYRVTQGERGGHEEEGGQDARQRRRPRRDQPRLLSHDCTHYACTQHNP